MISHYEDGTKADIQKVVTFEPILTHQYASGNVTTRYDQFVVPVGEQWRVVSVTGYRAHAAIISLDVIPPVGLTHYFISADTDLIEHDFNGVILSAGWTIEVIHAGAAIGSVISSVLYYKEIV